MVDDKDKEINLLTKRVNKLIIILNIMFNTAGIPDSMVIDLMEEFDRNFPQGTSILPPKLRNKYGRI